MVPTRSSQFLTSSLPLIYMATSSLRKRTGYEPVATDPYPVETTTTVLGVELTEDEAIMCKIAVGLIVLMIGVLGGAIIASSF